MADVKSLLDTIDNLEPRSAATGYFMKTRLEVVYKVFASGVDQKATSFPFDPTAPAQKEIAKAKAQAFITENALSSARPIVCLALTCFRETAKGASLTWQSDQIKVYPTFGKDYSELWKKALGKLNVTALPWEGWGHVIFVPSPDRKEKAQNSEEMVASRVWMLEEIYPTEAACEAAAKAALAAAGQTAVDTGAFFPKEFSTIEMWNKFKPMLQADQKAGKSHADIAKAYGITEAFMDEWKAKGYA